MAVNDLLFEFWPENNQPPASNAAVRGRRNQIPRLKFGESPATDRAVFAAIMPPHYSGGGINVIHGYSMASAITGAVDNAGAFETRAGLNQDSDSFAAAKSVNGTTVPATNGDPAEITITFANTEIDGISAGDPFRYYFERTGGNAAGDQELLYIKGIET